MILLVSGGLDSIAAWRLLGSPDAIRFDLGTRSNEREEAAVQWAHDELAGSAALLRSTALHVGLHERGNGYVPYRNALLVLRAAQHDPHVIVPMIAEWAPDKNVRFFRRLERLMNTMGAGEFQGMDVKAKIDVPFAHTTKAQLLRAYADKFGIGALDALLQGTWSCYEGERLHCGECSGCVQRYVAEVNALDGRADRWRVTEYRRQPDVRSFYHGRLSVSDAARWLWGNGYAVNDLVRRAREARYAAGIKVVSAA